MVHQRTMTMCFVVVLRKTTSRGMDDTSSETDTAQGWHRTTVMLKLRRGKGSTAGSTVTASRHADTHALGLQQTMIASARFPTGDFCSARCRQDAHSPLLGVYSRNNRPSHDCHAIPQGSIVATRRRAQRTRRCKPQPPHRPRLRSPHPSCVDRISMGCA